MKKLALGPLVCVVLPMQHAVIAQQTGVLRLVNDWGEGLELMPPDPR